MRHFRVKVIIEVSDDRPPIEHRTPDLPIPIGHDPESLINALSAGLIEGIEEMTKAFRSLPHDPR